MSGDGEYRLFYWPGLPGRGEFIRLAFEEAGVAYEDVGQRPEAEGGGTRAIVAFIREARSVPPFAPPILAVGEVVIAQVANVLQFLGPRLDLVAGDEASRLAANQLQLTIADFVAEVHDTHHPVSASCYYEDQKPEALRAARQFLDTRMPKYLGYFERTLGAKEPRDYLAGDRLSYVDLSMFQVLSGLAYAFPRAYERSRSAYPGLESLRAHIAARPRLAAYLASDRRQAFNESGIFRHYPELDG